jgi:thiol:disulfide interchange protein DsbD
MLLVAFAGWIFGAGGRKWWSAVLALAVIAAGVWFFLGSAMTKSGKGAETATANAVGITWEPFSPDRVEAARKAGQPVFIDFTAAWCANCILNERTVLNTTAIGAAFKEKKVLTLKADWTDFDPVITEWLKKFDRIGVPVYVLYRPGEEAPVVFPELLKQKLVLDALALIGGK